MPAWLVKLAIPTWGYYAAGGVLLCLALFGLHRCSVHDAVKADRNAAQAQVAKAALGAERAANASDAPRQAEIQANDATTRKAIDDAVAKNPQGAARAAGPAVNAVADQLRKRQAGSHPAAH